MSDTAASEKGLPFFVSKHVFIAVPTYTGQLHFETMRSIVGSITALLQRGDRYTLYDESGSAMIGHARSMILAQFLHSGASHLVMVDADVVFSADHLLRLVDAPVDFVGGIYPHRRDPLGFCVLWDTSKDEIWADPETGLIEAYGIPAGFMCLTREAVMRMYEAYADKHYADKYAPGGTAIALFDNIHEPPLYWGEDYSFCRRWREIGGKVWFDPEMRLGHVGYKTFSGHIGDYMRGNIDQ